MLEYTPDETTSDVSSEDSRGSQTRRCTARMRRWHTRDLHMVPACQEWNRLAAVDEPEAANSCLARWSLQHHRRSLQLPRMPAPPFHISPKLRGITSAPATADTTEVWLSATPCRSFLATSPFFICLTN